MSSALACSDLVKVSVYDMYLSTTYKAMINSKSRIDLVSATASMTESRDHSE